MVKVTIEATGEETQVLTGEMVNAVITTENGCKVACIANSNNEVEPKVFIRSLVTLVNTAIKSYSLNDISCELLHTLFVLEMSNSTKRENSNIKASNKQKEQTEKSVEDAFKKFIEIFGKVVE